MTQCEEASFSFLEAVKSGAPEEVRRAKIEAVIAASEAEVKRLTRNRLISRVVGIGFTVVGGWLILATGPELFGAQWPWVLIAVLALGGCAVWLGAHLGRRAGNRPDPISETLGRLVQAVKEQEQSEQESARGLGPSVEPDAQSGPPSSTNR